MIIIDLKLNWIEIEYTNVVSVFGENITNNYIVVAMLPQKLLETLPAKISPFLSQGQFSN